MYAIVNLWTQSICAYVTHCVWVAIDIITYNITRAPHRRVQHFVLGFINLFSFDVTHCVNFKFDAMIIWFSWPCKHKFVTLFCRSVRTIEQRMSLKKRELESCTEVQCIKTSVRKIHFGPVLATTIKTCVHIQCGSYFLCHNATILILISFWYTFTTDGLFVNCVLWGRFIRFV